MHSVHGMNVDCGFFMQGIKMKKTVCLLLLLMAVVVLTVLSQSERAAAFPSQLLSAEHPTDTIKKEEKLIANVIQHGAQPATETISAIHDFTKFGFRNLFNDFQYNPSLPYNQQVHPQAELYMSSYLQKHEKELINLKKKSGLYFDLIDNIFRQYGLPTELKYLAVIESSLQTGATSVVGAAGPWQFMPQTAKNMGLRVSPELDERRDFYKSTHAAARYLLMLYRTYHDWLLVIAAYNGGNGHVDRAIQRSHSNNFWQLQHQLPEESRNHVKKFIATHYIMENKNGAFINAEPKVNAPTLTPEELKNTIVIEVTGRFLSSVIIRQLQMDAAAFNHMNPDFDERLEKEGRYPMRLENNQSVLFISKKYEILNLCIQQLLSADKSTEVKKH